MGSNNNNGPAMIHFSSVILFIFKLMAFIKFGIYLHTTRRKDFKKPRVTRMKLSIWMMTTARKKMRMNRQNLLNVPIGLLF